MPKNQVFRDNLVAEKMVPDMSDTWARQLLHWKSFLLFNSQWPVWPQSGHTNPFGHRQRKRASRHCSSVPKWDKNSCKLSPFWNWISFFAMAFPPFVDLEVGYHDRGITERAPRKKIGWVSCAIKNFIIHTKCSFLLHDQARYVVRNWAVLFARLHSLIQASRSSLK